MLPAAALLNSLSLKQFATALFRQSLHYYTFNIKTVDRLFWVIISYHNLFNQTIQYAI